MTRVKLGCMPPPPPKDEPQYLVVVRSDERCYALCRHKALTYINRTASSGVKVVHAIGGGTYPVPITAPRLDYM